MSMVLFTAKLISQQLLDKFLQFNTYQCFDIIYYSFKWVNSDYNRAYFPYHNILIFIIYSYVAMERSNFNKDNELSTNIAFKVCLLLSKTQKDRDIPLETRINRICELSCLCLWTCEILISWSYSVLLTFSPGNNMPYT